MKPELQRRVQRYGWDKAAVYYESAWKQQLEPAHDRMLELAGLQAGENVLETACGTGLVVFLAAQAVAPDGQVLGTDISDAMVQTATETAEQLGLHNAHFQQMDAEQLDLEDARFDVALSGLGLMYMPQPERALQQMQRVLKPGGRVAVAIWGERKQCGWAEIFPIVDHYVASDVCPMFFQQGTGNTLHHSLESAGFEQITTERFDTVLRFESTEQLLTAVFSGGPVALAYDKFDEKTKAEARAEYLQTVTGYRNGNGYDIPGEFVVAAGYKPEGQSM